jgi:Type IV secretory pathway, VirB9 components
MTGNKLKKINKRILSILFLTLISANIFANDGNAKNDITVDTVKNNQKLFDDDGILSGKKEAIKKTSVVFNYSENSIYEVYSKPDYLTTLRLAPNEKVIFKAGGDTERWMIEEAVGGKENRTYIYIKPLEEDIKTNINIVTDKHSYFINIESKNGEYNPLVEWQYPNERKILMNEYEDNSEAIGTTDLMKLNYRYFWNKNSKLSPVQVFDNGKKTFIVLKANLQEMPAFYVKGLDNQLSLVNTKIEGRNVMINSVVKEIHMTLGKKTLKIYNRKK